MSIPETDRVNQRITGTLVQREVVHCCSSMIEHLYKDELFQGELLGIMSQEDYKSACEEFDYLLLTDNYECCYIIPVGKGEEKNFDYLDDIYTEGSEITLAGWYECTDCKCDDYDIIAGELGIEPHTKEALEHWIVTPWMADWLKEQGEMVSQVFDFHVWGRTTSGQSISMDTVIFEIANDMEILKGQVNSWE